MKIRVGEDGKTVYDENNNVVGHVEDGKIKFDPVKPDERGKYDLSRVINNTASMNNGQNNPGNKEPEQKSEPPKQEKVKVDVKKTKYEVTKDTKFKIEFGIAKVDDRYIIINKEHVSYTSESEPVWATFRMWTYLEELKWKDECLEYNAQSKSQFLNTNKLNEIKIKNLILDWSFSAIDDKFKLLHTDGKLSDESYSVFCGLLPNIANAIVNLMNDVLENNK